MPDAEHEVVYRAVADFADVFAKAAALRAELKALKADTDRWHADTAGKSSQLARQQADAIAAPAKERKANLPVEQQYSAVYRQQVHDLDNLTHSQLRYLDALELTAKQLKHIRDLEKHEQTLQHRDATLSERLNQAQRTGMIRADTLQDKRVYDDLVGEAKAVATSLKLADEAAQRRTKVEHTAIVNQGAAATTAARLATALSNAATAADRARITHLRLAEVESKVRAPSVLDSPVFVRQMGKAVESMLAAKSAPEPSILDSPSFRRSMSSSVDKLLADIRRTERVLSADPVPARVTERAAARRRRERPLQAFATGLRSIQGAGFDLAKGFITALRGSEKAGLGRVGDAARGAVSGGGGTEPPPVSRIGAGLSGMGDAVLGGLSKLGKTLFSWRGLIILAVAALGPLIATLGALGGAAIGVAGNLISFAGTLAALPGLLAAGAAGAAALFVALQPMAAVFTAFAAKQKLVTAGTAQLAETQRLSAAKVRDAQHSLVSASKAIVDAQFQERMAQMSLNDARREATRNLEDLLTQLGRASLSEEGAILALQRAQLEYRKTLADPTSDLLGREEALYRVKVAENDLVDVRTKNVRLAQDAALAQQRGVEGSPQVLSANKAVQDSSFATANAVYEMQKATQDLAIAQLEQAAGGAEMLAADRALQAALENLGPSARAVAVALLDQYSNWRRLKLAVGEAVFTPVLAQIHNLIGLLPVVNDLLVTAGGAIGGIIAKGVEMVRADGPWKSDWAALIASVGINISNMGDAALYVAEGFKDIAVAALPFSEWISGKVRDIALGFRDWAASAKDHAVANFLEDTKNRLLTLWGIAKDLGSFVGSIFSSSQDFSRTWLGGIADVAASWAKWGKEQEKPQSAFRNWLQQIQPLLSSVWALISQLGLAIASLAADPENIKEAQRILIALATQVLPPLLGIFHELSQSHALSDVVTGIGNLLSAVQKFLQAGGILPVTIFLNMLLKVFGAIAHFVALPGVAQVFTGWATELALLAAASVAYKFAGFFKLTDALKWLLSNKTAFGFMEKLLGKGIADKLAGNIAAPAQAAANTQIEAARLQQGAADTMLIAARAMSTERLGTVGTVGAAATPRAAGGLVSASGKPLQQVTDKAGNIVGVAQVGETAAAGTNTGILSRLKGGAGTAAGIGLFIGGTALGSAADSGTFGAPQTPAATFARAGGAVATGAGLGFQIAPGPWGAAAGAIAGGIYSEAKDKGLRQITGDFLRNPVAGTAVSLTGVGAIATVLANTTGIFGTRGGPSKQSRLNDQLAVSDTELAKMVKSGQLTEAATSFKVLAEDAGKFGYSLDAVRKATPAYQATLKALIQVQLAAEAAMSDTDRATKAYTDALAAIPTDAGHAKDALKSYGVLLDTINGSQLDAGTKADLFSKILDNIASNAAPQADKLGVLAHAFNEIAASTVGATTKSDLLRKSLGLLHDPFRSAVQASNDWTTSEAAFKTATDQSSTSIDQKTGYVKQNIAELNASIDASEAVYLSDVRTNTLSEADARAAHLERLKRLADESGATGPAKQQVLDYIHSYDGVPKDPIITPVGVDQAGIDAALQALKPLIISGYVVSHVNDPDPSTLVQRATDFADQVIAGAKAAQDYAAGKRPIPGVGAIPGNTPGPPVTPTIPGSGSIPGTVGGPGTAIPGAGSIPGTAPDTGPTVIGGATLGNRIPNADGSFGNGAKLQTDQARMETAAFAAEKFAEAEKRLKDAVGKTATTVDAKTGALKTNEKEIHDAIDASVLQYQTDVRVNGLSEADAYARHQARLKRIGEESGATGDLKTQVELLIAKYGEIPPDKRTDVTLNLPDHIWGDLSNMSILQYALTHGISPAEAKAAIDKEISSTKGWALSGSSGPPPNLATGGPVTGSGGPTEDNIPAWLSAGEHIWTAMEVARAGGHNAVKRIRDAVMGKGSRVDPTYADGGPVWPIPVDLTKTKIPDVKAALANTVKYSPSGGGVGQWAPLGAAVLAELLQPSSSLGALMRRIDFESGGHPDIVNKVDSNWQAGHPSVGLMQVIAGTFAQYAGQYRNTGPFSYGVSVDPHANVYAGANYAIHRYGSVAAVDPMVMHSGYDSGGVLRPGTTVATNNTGEDETVRTGADERRLQRHLAGLYAGLDTNVRGTRMSRTTPRSPGAAAMTVQTLNQHHDNGIHLSDVTINNPVREPTERSLRRKLQTLTFLRDR